MLLNGERTAIWDLMGKDATLFRHSAEEDQDSLGAEFVRQSGMWFDSLWDSVGREYR